MSSRTASFTRRSVKTISTDQKRDHNAELSVNRLPAEVLSQIFEHALDELRDTWPSETCDDVRLAITGVCSWWRAIAIADPALWGILVYQDNEEVTLWSNRWTLLCISRSGDSPLDVSISVLIDNFDEDDEESGNEDDGNEQFSRLLIFMNTIKSVWRRVSSVIVQVHSWEALDAIFPFPEAGPNLRHIEVDNTDYRWGPSLARLRLFPPNFEGDFIARNYPNIESLKISIHRMSLAEISRVIECLPNIRFLRLGHPSFGMRYTEILPPTLRISTPYLEKLVLVQSYLSSTTFDTPNLQYLEYELPVDAEGECVDFFPFPLEHEPGKLTSQLLQLTLGDIRGSSDFFEPAVRLLRSYSDVSVLRLHGKEALGRLLCASFGDNASITSPGAKNFEGLTAPSALRRLEIKSWNVAEANQSLIQIPDPAELTELAEVLLELLKNTSELVVKWWSLDDPTRNLHPAFARLRQTCEKMMMNYPKRVFLKLA